MLAVKILALTAALAETKLLASPASARTISKAKNAKFV